MENSNLNLKTHLSSTLYCCDYNSFKSNRSKIKDKA